MTPKNSAFRVKKSVASVMKLTSNPTTLYTGLRCVTVKIALAISTIERA